MKVVIDSRTNIEYCAYYIYGLTLLYGVSNVSFSLKNFSDLNTSYNFNFIIYSSSYIKKISIDYDDDCSIKSDLHEWCSVYAKINYRGDTVKSSLFNKVLNITPSFGVSIWGFNKTVFYAIGNYLKVYSTVTSSKKFFSKYYKQYRSIHESDYMPEFIKNNYIFSVNTLWNSDEWIQNDNMVNKMRLNFYQAAKSFSYIESEVGFVYSQNKNYNPVYTPFILEKPVTKSDYLRKTKKSVLVFNTPAWDQCHGWKLAEYLALGKAIISTPFYNELPYPLEHGKHIHFVSGTVEEIQQAIHQIVNDTAYREMLQRGARKYYLDYVQPKQVIKHIVDTK